MGFRDRFFTPPVARAITSPLGIVAAGAGAAVGLATGLPIVLAVAAGALAYGVRVAAAVPRKAPKVEIDSFALAEPWRKFVQEVQVTSRRFNDVVAGIPPGPMRERMAQISQRIDAGVEECWVAAGHGDRLAKARSRLDTKDKAKELSRLRSAGAPEPGSSAARTAEALQAQLDSAARLDATIEATRDRLRLLDARMAEALARAVELSVDNARADELNGLNDTVEGVVAEMESLRLGLEET